MFVGFLGALSASDMLGPKWPELVKHGVATCSQ